MFLVKVYLDYSKLDGKGIFAGEFIPKGKKIWEHDDDTVNMYSEQEWQNLLKKSTIKKRNELLKFSYRENNIWILHTDIMKFMNHSEHPNVLTNTPELTKINWDLKKSYTYAARDIKEGEELTENYKEYFDDEIWLLHQQEKCCNVF